MQRRSDPRHLKRQEAVKELFSFSFNNPKVKTQLAKEVIGSFDRIDRTICRCAPEWPIEKIGKIDLAILRLAIYELDIARSQPPKVIIDEAVELGKEFGGESTPGFINGVLGTALKEMESK